MTTKTKERPVLFSGAMVRAILSGAKTQTRRIVKPQPETYMSESGLQFEWPNWHGSLGAERFANEYSPLGQPGDLIRISEAVTVTAISDDQFQVLYHADKSLVVRYGEPELIAKIRAYKSPHLRGVHLPPAYARDWRGVLTKVRVERLQEIKNEDTQYEGIEFDVWDQALVARDYSKPNGWFQCWSENPVHKYVPTERIGIESFRSLWESLYGPESWNANPWVWVHEHKTVEVQT